MVPKFASLNKKSISQSLLVLKTSPSQKVCMEHSLIKVSIVLTASRFGRANVNVPSVLQTIDVTMPWCYVPQVVSGAQGY